MNKSESQLVEHFLSGSCARVFVDARGETPQVRARVDNNIYIERTDPKVDDQIRDGVRVARYFQN